MPRLKPHFRTCNGLRRRIWFAVPVLVLASANCVSATDYFLTIGGGYAPEGNQASLEKNVLFFQRLLKEQKFPPQSHTVFFADGTAAGKDLQVKDLESLPRANRLMAEFFGSERDLGVSYRNHEVPGVRGSTQAANIRQWFSDVGPSMRRGDRLVLYVTAHGEPSDDRDNRYDTAISLWDNQRLSVTDLVELLDRLPEEIRVVAIMVQCYTGGFARFVYNDADPDKGLSRQERCGFFATVHDREASGCTPDVDEATYVEYSTYFWEALGGRTRLGQPIQRPDYDRDGRVSFAEAHAYTVLKADTIDLPLKTSGEFLSVESQFADEEHRDLLPEDAPYDAVYKLAMPEERAILDALSEQLELTGNQRIETAQNESERPRRGARRRRGRSSNERAERLRDMIADDLEARWPELANVLNPGAIELVTTRSELFVQAVEQHPRYREYREQKEIAARRPDPQRRRVKYERFLRTTEDVILRENLKRLRDQRRLAQYEAIVAAESSALGSAAPSAPRAAAR
jgi:hypothetical protein